eukprot:CAMPEP_0176388194 /NCGR_PEP_ID=MMETSP0126-20121128/37386_1 /TAXON_ID=141414 ORGANISM="Strombidinopsis acuminatum, Strain SPMC142" /NCGR_SAMPLE_ID=MMETSP0126 /ASSEMBLY_ACC=CAM_ASM_000229 /LENGTH=77 /DNA_ID=CAMNT_0017756271 /DNA_START=234 /DNA_END=467 /DNA_ORIENTATION=-
MKNGEGKEQDAQGTIMTGIWKDDKYVGKGSPKKVQEFVSPPKDAMLRSKTVVQKKPANNSLAQKDQKLSSASKKPAN